MAATSRQNPYYYISQAAITISPNAVDGDPSYVAVSVVTGTLIMLSVKHYAQFVEGLDYTADQQNPTWRLSGYSTKLQDEYADKQVYIYARLVADASNGLLVFSDEDYTSTISADGNSSDPGIAKKDNYIYVKLGYLTVPYSGKRDVNWDSGCLLTQYAEDTKDEFGELFNLVNNLIEPLKNFSKLTVNGLLTALGGLKVNGTWLFNNYEITNLKAYADYEKQLGTVISATDDFDKYLPSMKLIFSYINNHLRNDIDSIAKGKITFAGGINLDDQDITGVDVGSDVPNGGLTEAKDTSIPTTAAMVKHVQKHGDANYLSKVKDDTAKGKITFKEQQQFDKGFEVGNYTPGVADGTGGAMEVRDGNTHLTTDYLNVRRKARFNEVEIQTTHHIGGAQISSAASCKIDFVQTVFDANGNPSAYRCYFRKTDKDGNIIGNPWKVGDQAYCNTFNLEQSADGKTGNHFLWMLVLYVADKGADNIIADDGQTYNGTDYAYINLSATRCAEGSDAPLGGDEIVLLGHQKQSAESTGEYEYRQTAIYQSSANPDGGKPYYRQYVGINSFSLDGCLEQQFMPGDNIFSGKVVIKGGSGWEELTDKNGNKLGDKIKNVKGTFISKSEPTFTSYQDALMHEGYTWYNPNTKETKVWVNTQADDFEWKPVSDFSYKYLEEALRGSTAVVGGLVMTNLLMLGKYTDDDTLNAENATSGINGLVEDDNSVAVWGGGTLSKAQKLVTFYKDNPKAQPTEEELKAMAKFVITHGGKAILQDAIISGTVHATSGSFINGEFRYGTFKDVVINGSYNKLVQTINKDNLNEFFEIKTILYGGSQITAYYPLLNKWGDVIHLDMEGAENLINKIFLPYSIPSYEDGKVIFLDGIGYKVLNEDVRHPMNVDDLRSLIGRQIIIHGRNIGSQLFLECPIYRNDTIDLSGDSDILDKPQGTWVYSTPEEPKSINIANGGCVILECLLVERYYPNSAGGFTSSEMITWGYRHIRTSRDSSTKVEITITIYDTGADTHYYYNALMDMTWDEFVSSSYNTNSDFYTDGPYVILRTENGDRRIQTVMNDGTNDTAVQYTDTIFGNVTYYAL